MSFIELCRKLSKAKKCGCNFCLVGNEYLCAYNAIKEYVQEDKSKLLKLKAECAKDNFGEFLSSTIAILALYISAIECLTSVSNVENMSWFKIVAPGILVFLFIVAMYMMEKFKCVSKWRSYIGVAIEEVEKELNDIEM